jgi:hypothetical protein
MIFQHHDRALGLKMTTGAGSLFPTPVGPFGGLLCYPLHLRRYHDSRGSLYRDRVVGRNRS